MAKPSLPSPDEILAREAGPRRIAAYSALASALLIVIAMLLEYVLSHKDIPDFDATDIVQTLAATHDAQAYPRSFLRAVGEFRIQHNGLNLLIWVLRGVALLLLIPMAQLLLRGVRDRGGQLGSWVAPANLIGMVLSALVTFVIFGILEPGIYRTARDAGFLPSDVWDAVRDSPINAAQILQFVGSVLVGVTVSLGSMQALRTGLLPKAIGYAGVLVGFMFVFPLDQSNIVRAFWFIALAFLVSPRTPNTPEAWTTGTAVVPEPRQPRTPAGSDAEPA